MIKSEHVNHSNFDPAFSVDCYGSIQKRRKERHGKSGRTNQGEGRRLTTAEDPSQLPQNCPLTQLERPTRSESSEPVAGRKALFSGRATALLPTTTRREKRVNLAADEMDAIFDRDYQLFL